MKRRSEQVGVPDRQIVVEVGHIAACVWQAGIDPPVYVIEGGIGRPLQRDPRAGQRIIYGDFDLRLNDRAEHGGGAEFHGEEAQSSRVEAIAIAQRQHQRQLRILPGRLVDFSEASEDFRVLSRPLARGRRLCLPLFGCFPDGLAIDLLEAASRCGSAGCIGIANPVPGSTPGPATRQGFERRPLTWQRGASGRSGGL